VKPKFAKYVQTKHLHKLFLKQTVT